MELVYHDESMGMPTHRVLGMQPPVPPPPPPPPPPPSGPIVPD